MFIGKIIGNLWATRKHESVNGFKLLCVQPMNAHYENTGSPIFAVDTIGAGVGEYVFYATASEAPIPMRVGLAPVDAAVVGIIDYINV